MRARLSGRPKNNLASKRGQSPCSSLDCIHPQALIGNHQCSSAADAHRSERGGAHLQTLIAPPEEFELKGSRHVLSPFLSQLISSVPLPSPPIVC